MKSAWAGTAGQRRCRGRRADSRRSRVDSSRVHQRGGRRPPQSTERHGRGPCGASRASRRPRSIGSRRGVGDAAASGPAAGRPRLDAAGAAAGTAARRGQRAASAGRRRPPTPAPRADRRCGGARGTGPVGGAPVRRRVAGLGVRRSTRRRAGRPRSSRGPAGGAGQRRRPAGWQRRLLKQRGRQARARRRCAAPRGPGRWATTSAAHSGQRVQVRGGAACGPAASSSSTKATIASSGRWSCPSRARPRRTAGAHRSSGDLLRPASADALGARRRPRARCAARPARGGSCSVTVPSFTPSVAPISS